VGLRTCRARSGCCRSRNSAGFYDFNEYEQLLIGAGADQVAYLIVLLGGEAGLRCGEMMALE
jgi:hypothetical protein